MLSFAPEEKHVHLIETFRNLTDYCQFESTVIWPFLREARGWAIIYADSQLSISTAPGRPSIEDICHFLNETDYNRKSYPFPNKSTFSENTSSGACPVSTPLLVGYIVVAREHQSLTHADLEGAFFFTYDTKAVRQSRQRY